MEMVDPVLGRYALVAIGLLVVAGFILLGMRLAGKNVASIWQTYRGWLIMAPLLLITLWAGRVPTILGLGLLSMLGFREFARATGLHRHWWYTVSVYIGIVSLCVLELMTDPRTGMAGWYGMFMATPVFMIALLVTVPVLRNKAEGQLQLVSLSIVGFIYMGWMFGHLAFLANSTNAYGYLLYLFFAVQLNDVAAFTFGKLFGRHKLRNNVSPNKTLEGSLGALAVSMCMPWLLHFSFPHFGLIELLLSGAIVGIGGQLGDLTISAIKRDLGVKDMGSLIPGHGGILDRLDSLIFTAPLFFHMVRWFHDLY